MVVRSEIPHSLETDLASIQLRSLIHPRNGLEIPSEVEPLFKHIGLAVRDADRQLADLADQKSNVVVRLTSPLETENIRTATVSTLARILKENPDFSHVSFLYGSTPVLWELVTGLSGQHRILDRIHPVVVNGTGVNGVDGARIATPIDFKEIANGTPYLLVFEELIDTAAGVGLITEEWYNARFGPQRHTQQIVQTLASAYGKSYEDYAALYKDIVVDMEASGLVASISFSKNEPFIRELRRAALAAKEKGSPWGKLQHQFTKGMYVQEYPAMWLMGEGADTGITGEDMYRFTPSGMAQNPFVHAVFEEIVHYKIRIGSTISGIIANQGSFEDFASLTAALFAESLKRRQAEIEPVLEKLF